MDFSEIIYAIYQKLLQLVPLFRMVWGGTIVLGAAMLIIALVLKKNPVRKKSPWIVGGFGLLIMISSGAQFVLSFC